MAKTGYCSVCRRPDIKTINKAIEAGLSYASVRDMVPSPPAKATFFKHKEHVTSPLITDAEAARRSPVIRPQSNKETLEAIRDIGFNNIMENPQSISTAHTLKAAQILAEKETRTDNVKIILAKLVTQPAQPMLTDTVDGEYSVIEGD